MRISPDLVFGLRDRGIIVRWFPEKTFEEFKQRVWQQQYENYVEYYKNHVAGCDAVLNGRANVVYNSFEELQDRARQHADNTVRREINPYDYTTLIIEYDNGKTLVKKENVKSKRIYEEYIMKLIEKDRKLYSGTYGNFALAMQKLCRENNLGSRLSVYPTTYGIGVWVFFNFDCEKDIEKVRAIMDSHGVEYYNEFSDKRWVYRFKVSKKSENLARLSA